MLNSYYLRFGQASILVLAVAISTSALAQSARSPDTAPPPPLPMTTMQPLKAAPDMQVVLDQLTKLGSKPVETLTPAQAREIRPPQMRRRLKWPQRACR